jgi:hypothetical protein
MALSQKLFFPLPLFAPVQFNFGTLAFLRKVQIRRLGCASKQKDLGCQMRALKGTSINAARQGNIPSMGQAEDSDIPLRTQMNVER